jgi:hypothetical protein
MSLIAHGETWIKRTKQNKRKGNITKEKTKKTETQHEEKQMQT